jgi:uncharacterized protein (DUF427 family)
MAKAMWNGVVLAESDDIAQVEGNPYFPKHSVNWDYFSAAAEAKPTYCHWKGVATYFDITVDGETNPGACWTYVEPYEESASITDRVAFWNGVEIAGASAESGQVEKMPSEIGAKQGWEAICWLIKHSHKQALGAAEISAITGLSEADIPQAWQAHDVQRYSKRYKWHLVESADTGEALRMEKTGS